ncbi:MAG: glutathione S-transferase family protein [Ardenticatenaceae bacterium]|nr:glutathione S-transferase family protein [Ardenticatenaceae bacterium]
MDHSLKLVSFKLCPFVQRAVITLLHRKIPFEIEYIDLAQKPAWFLEISPLGKVPVLIVDDDKAIFESSVINELLSELSEPMLHPADPIERAINRAWIAYAAQLQGMLYRLESAPNEAAFLEYQQRLRKLLLRLEKALADGPFFNGEDPSLVDFTYAPIFMRLKYLHNHYPITIFDGSPQTAEWATSLINLPEVAQSVVSDYKDRYHHWLLEHNGFLQQMLSPS